MNDAERVRHDPAMCWIVGGKAAQCCAASPSQMGRFETQWLAAFENLSALADLSDQWIDLEHGRRPSRDVVLDMTRGEQGNSVCHGQYAFTCYHPLFVFNQMLIRRAARCVPATFTEPMAGAMRSSSSLQATRARSRASAPTRALPEN